MSFNMNQSSLDVPYKTCFEFISCLPLFDKTLLNIPQTRRVIDLALVTLIGNYYQVDKVVFEITYQGGGGHSKRMSTGEGRREESILIWWHWLLFKLTWCIVFWVFFRDKGGRTSKIWPFWRWHTFWMTARWTDWPVALITDQGTESPIRWSKKLLCFVRRLKS